MRVAVCVNACAFRVRARVCIVEPGVRSDGQNFQGGQLATGGGAGGTVIIEASVLSGVGALSVQGGSSSWGGGSGGVIMVMTVAAPSVQWFVSGGSSNPQCDMGSPGIIYLNATGFLQCGPASAVPYLISQTQISTLPSPLTALQLSDCNWILPAQLAPLATVSFFNAVVQVSHTLNVSGAMSLNTGTYLLMANGAQILAGSLGLRHSLIKVYDQSRLTLVVAGRLLVDTLSYIHFTTTAVITANEVVLENTLTQEDLSTNTMLNVTAQSIKATPQSSILASYISLSAPSMLLEGSITGVAANQQICVISFPTLPCQGGAMPSTVSCCTAAARRRLCSEVL
jgi:hypothetical protein